MTALTLLRRHSRTFLPVTVATLIFFAGFALGSQSSTARAQSTDALPPEAQTLLKPVWEAFTLIRTRFVDPKGLPLDEAKLIDGALKGMAATLGDKYSYYIAPQKLPSFTNSVQGEFVGIGAVVNTNPDNGDIHIIQVLPGSPSEQAGLQPGDVFVTFDGTEVRTLTQKELVARAQGPEGSTVQVTIRRGEDLIDLTITRAKLVKPNTETHLFNQDIGYIKLKQFSPNARAEVDAALASLNPTQLNGLVLDLRGNPGGQLNSLVQVASSFLRNGVILTEKLADHDKVFTTDGTFAGFDLPMVVLVDHTSMSAAEALTGALQDHGRATILGVQTFGKGTAQSVVPLSNGGALRLTIARWLTPDNHWIHTQGITPDIVVPATGNEDVQLQAAIRTLQAQIDALQAAS